MRNQLRKVLMACVALLAILALFSMTGDHPLARSGAYLLLPTLPLLASLYAMHWVKGMAYTWWLRIAIPWTIISMLLVLIVPQMEGKAMVSTLTVFLFSLATVALIFNKSFMEQYRIAMSDAD